MSGSRSAIVLTKHAGDNTVSGCAMTICGQLVWKHCMGLGWHDCGCHVFVDTSDTSVGLPVYTFTTTIDIDSVRISRPG
ncbi:hypothetical protein J6590_010288 [Homalodisca vitripennis]|nr:hypothetical protein J6590_010288 [Homalodisca vitripennis]